MFGLLGWLVPLAATFALTPMIVHGLGAESYGLYALIVGIIGYLATLNFNVGRVITKYLAAGEVGHQSDLIGEVLSSTLFLYMVIGLTSAAALILLADPLMGRVLHITPGFQPAVRLSLYIGAAGLLFAMLSQLFGAVPQALQRFDLYGYITIGSGVAAIGGNGMMVWMGYGFTSLIVWNVVVSLLACLAYGIVARRLLPGVKLAARFRKNLLPELLRFSGAVTVYQIVGNVMVLAERGWLARSLGAGSVTYYVVPMTIAVYLHAFVSSLTLVIFPMASEANARQDTARLHRIYTRALKYVSVVVVFIAVALSCASHELLSIWMGEGFADLSGTVLRIHVITFSILAMLVVPWQIADGLGFPGCNAFVSVLWLLIGIPAAALLTPRWGILGVACARLAAMAVVPFYMVYIERRVFGGFLWDFWRRVGLSLAAAGGLSAVFLTGLLRWLPSGWIWLSVSVLLSGSMMLAILWLVGYLDKTEKDWLRQFVTDAVGASPA